MAGKPCRIEHIGGDGQVKMKNIMAALLMLLMLANIAALAEGAEAYFPNAPKDDATADWLAGAGQDVVQDQMYDISEFAVTEGLPDNWVNLLLLGSDTRRANQYGNTDGIIIMSVNLARRQVKLTSIMRDMWVTMAGRSKSGKIATACAQGGPALAMRTLNECFGLNIQYYAQINLSGMAEVIDDLGGLDMDVTLEELNALNKGLFDLSPLSGMEPLMEYGSDVHLNGNQAVAYARIRNIDSDIKRMGRDRDLMQAIAKRLQQESGGTIVGVVMKLLDCVETNMNLTQLMTIAAVGLEMELSNIPALVVPVENTYRSGTFTLDGRRVWCIRPDFPENTKQILNFIYGE